MRRLQWYLIRQVMTTLIMSVAVFTFILLLANVLKSVLELLVSRQAEPGMVLVAIGLLIPYVLVYSLPIGMLTSLLLVMGRFSADNELTAARANGLSLTGLTVPLVGLSLVFCLVSAYLNLDLAPRCRSAFKGLLFEATQQNLTAMIPEGTFIRDFPGYIFYAGKVDGQRLKDVMFYQTEGNRKVQDIRAPRARLEQDAEAHALRLVFYDAILLKNLDSLRGQGEGKPSSRRPQFLVSTVEEIEVELPLPEKRDFHGPKIQELTFGQLLAERERLLEANLQPEDISPILVQMNSKLAFSFAPFGFTLIGIPLGVRAHRRETTAGMALAIILMLIYNGFFVMGHGWQTRPAYFPHLLVWVPNFLFQLLGGWMLRRANQG